MLNRGKFDSFLIDHRAGDKPVTSNNNERLRMYNIDNGTTLDIPTPLSRKGRKAAAVIKKFMKSNGFSTGGSKMFYTPAEWRDRGESYGTTSELVFVYDGGDLHSIVNHEFGYQAAEQLRQLLENVGVYYECCTGWYSAIYEC